MGKIFDIEGELKKRTTYRDEFRQRRLERIANDIDAIKPPESLLVPSADGQLAGTEVQAVGQKPVNVKLRSQAEEEATELIQKVFDNQKRMEQYKDELEKIKNLPNNIWNRKKIEEQRRKNETQIKEILQEQTALIQGSITLTIRTIEYASYIGQALGRIINDGFRTRDGHFQRLTGQTREVAETLLRQVQGTEAQLRVEQKPAAPVAQR